MIKCKNNRVTAWLPQYIYIYIWPNGIIFHRQPRETSLKQSGVPFPFLKATKIGGTKFRSCEVTFDDPWSRHLGTYHFLEKTAKKSLEISWPPILHSVIPDKPWLSLDIFLLGFFLGCFRMFFVGWCLFSPRLPSEVSSPPRPRPGFVPRF